MSTFATAVTLCAVHARRPFSCVVDRKKSPSFGFRQVDMYDSLHTKYQ